MTEGSDGMWHERKKTGARAEGRGGEHAFVGESGSASARARGRTFKGRKDEEG